MNATQPIYQWLEDQARNCADQFREQASPLVALYLFYKRGELRIAADKPDGFKIATGQRIPPGSERYDVIQFVLRNCQLIPCLPDEVTENPIVKPLGRIVRAGNPTAEEIAVGHVQTQMDLLKAGAK